MLLANVTAEPGMSMKQRLGFIDDSDILSFIAKEIDYEFQERRFKNSIDIFSFNN